MVGEDNSLFPENLVIGKCYSYLNRPSDYVGNENPQVIQRYSIKLIGKRFFHRNRRNPMYEISIHDMDEFRRSLEYNTAVELTFENGDVLTIRRTEDEDERHDGTNRNFINMYMFREENCPAVVAAGSKKKRKSKSKRRSIHLNLKKSLKHVLKRIMFI